MQRFTLFVINAALSIAMAIVEQQPTATDPQSSARGALFEIAAFDAHRPTGVAVSRSGRVFVNFPRWSDDHEWSVVEVLPDGSIRPFPDEAWNMWDGVSDPAKAFVCVQSVWIDDKDALWVLDPAAPKLESIVPGGPKLVKIELATNGGEAGSPGGAGGRVVDTILFDSSIAPEKSYLNDVRIDTGRPGEDGWAYITDSGLGAIIAVNLKTKIAQRLLDGHPSTRAEPGVSITVQGVELKTAGTAAGQAGGTPQIHADGIALTHDGEYLYWHALTGKTLYRIATAALREATDKEPDEAAGTARVVSHQEAVTMAVEKVAETVVTDGLLIDKDGRIYHTALEKNAIMRYVPGAGRMETVVQDEKISWPDSMAFGPQNSSGEDGRGKAGELYFTTSQIQYMPQFNPAGERKRMEPYRVFKVKLD